LFVPAGDLHRFEDFSEDLAVWGLFYGPEGGEWTGADRFEAPGNYLGRKEQNGE
jgi:hypothetical protein